MHYIGLVFVNTDHENIDIKLEPFDEQTNNEEYLEWDVYKEIRYQYNPNAKYDWYIDGGRWNGYIYTKDGHNVNCASFDDIDWSKMFTKVECSYELFGKEMTKMVSHHPCSILDLDNIWREDESDYLPFDSPEHEKMETEWKKEVEDYIALIAGKSEEDRKSILVYAIDFHI